MWFLYSTYLSFQHTVQKLGLDIAIKRHITKVPNHESVFPYASYAPWKIDTDFQNIYKTAKENTLVDIYRCYELWQLVEETKQVPWSIIEIWVWRWWTWVILAKKTLSLGLQDPVYLCDTFTGVVKATDADTAYTWWEHADTSFDHVKHLIQSLSLQNVQLLQWIFPDDTAHLIASDEKFRLCHIDVDVYQSAKDIVNWIWDKLSVWGVIVFDDYWFITCSGITTFVNEQRMKSDRIVIHNLNWHAIIIKLA